MYGALYCVYSGRVHIPLGGIAVTVCRVAIRFASCTVQMGITAQLYEQPRQSLNELTISVRTARVEVNCELYEWCQREKEQVCEHTELHYQLVGNVRKNVHFISSTSILIRSASSMYTLYGVNLSGRRGGDTSRTKLKEDSGVWRAYW